MHILRISSISEKKGRGSKQAKINRACKLPRAVIVIQCTEHAGPERRRGLVGFARRVSGLTIVPLSLLLPSQAVPRANVGVVGKYVRIHLFIGSTWLTLCG